MTKVYRRHFLMSSVALPVALKASALPSQNNTVRVAVVGFNGRGKAHISAYLKIPNVEIAALCDVDQAVVENGCKMIEAAGKKRLREGIIGDVYMARGLCFKWRDTIGRAKEEPVPAGVSYDLWTGPAPTKPFTRNRFHYNWHWQWDYGNGDIGNQGAHQIHTARTALGVKYPTQISSMGGHYMFDDD